MPSEAYSRTEPNYFCVKPSSQLCKPVAVSKDRNHDVVATAQSSHYKMSLKKLCRHIDKLQSRYGVPPVVRCDVKDDNIFPEFSSIWTNVMSFQFNIIETYPVEMPIQSSFRSSKVKSTKPAYKHMSVILENRPMKFKSIKAKKS